jgi:hypothetical protein
MCICDRGGQLLKLVDQAGGLEDTRVSSKAENPAQEGPHVAHGEPANRPAVGFLPYELTEPVAVGPQ